MAGQSRTTTDHDEIRRWAEERDGRPATIKGTAKKGEEAGLLRINFPGYKEENIEEISWEDFFEKFEQAKLAFLYQEETKGGEMSRFNKFVDREKSKNE
jgi:hypothetical protein